MKQNRTHFITGLLFFLLFRFGLLSLEGQNTETIKPELDKRLNEFAKKYASARAIQVESIIQDKKRLTISLPHPIKNGLQNRHIALWQSHGMYYTQAGQRWEWQQARIILHTDNK